MSEHDPTVDMSDDSEEFPKAVGPRSDPDRFLTLEDYTTKHVYGHKPRNGEWRSTCGSHTFETDDPEADQLTEVNARELMLAPFLHGDPGTGVSLCQRCRQSADLDRYVSPELLRQFVDGELDPVDEEEQLVVPEIDAEYIPVEISLDAEFKIPANERAYKMLEAVGRAAAQSTALDRQDTIAVEGEVVDEEADEDEPS